jgi:lysophospholipase L1-like esterase
MSQSPSMRKLLCALLVLTVIVAGTAFTASSSLATARYYVALGDSIAAGQGLPSRPAPNPCARSSKAYPVLLAANPSFVPSGTPSRSVACTGATTQDVLNTAQNVNGSTVPAQLAQIQGLRLGTVTVTVGVDNLDWTHRLTVCLTQGLSACKKFQKPILAGIATVRSQVGAIVSRVVAQGATRVIVTGYYDPFPTTSVTTAGGCDAIYVSAIDNALSNGTIALIQTWESDLNTALKAAATGNGGFFIGLGKAFPPSRRICLSGSRVIPLTSANVLRSAAMHPNASGQQAIAARIVAVAPPA